MTGFVTPPGSSSSSNSQPPHPSLSQQPQAQAQHPPYSPGLAGGIAGETAVSSVDGESGLLYRGYDIHELAVRASFEEVIYLLLRGELPNTSELEKTREELAADAPLPGAVRSMLRLMPARAHPIDV